MQLQLLSKNVFLPTLPNVIGTLGYTRIMIVHVGTYTHTRTRLTREPIWWKMHIFPFLGRWEGGGSNGKACV